MIAATRIIILSTLFIQALSAPSGCIESCNFHHTYQSRGSGGYQDHVALMQGSASLNEHDYARPGNWTEHNQYDTDDGHSKIHEERGQYVDSSKRVRYYKKNFTSSYGTDGVATVATKLDQRSSEYDLSHVPSDQRLDPQRAYDQFETMPVARKSGYNGIHNQQTQSSSRIDSRSERLEDFGENGGYPQISQQPVIDAQHEQFDRTPGNWSRVDSYRIDGGRGRVHEEEAQHVAGPKKVHHYKKNYTSSYSTFGMVPQADLSTIAGSALQDLHNELQQQVDSFKREFHRTSNAAATRDIGSTRSLTQETVGFHDDLQTADSDAYRQQSNRQHILVSPTSDLDHYADQQQRKYSDAIQRQYSPHAYPTAGSYSTESRSTYENRQTHVSQMHPALRSDHQSSGYVQVPVTDAGDSARQTSSYSAHSSSGRHAKVSSHQSGSARNQVFTEGIQRAYRPPNYAAYPNSQSQTTQHEEHWSSSYSHAGGNSAAERIPFAHDRTLSSDRARYDKDAYEQRNHRHATAQGYNDARAHANENSFAYRMTSGQLATLDLGQQAARRTAANCTREETQEYRQESRHHRNYKRDTQQRRAIKHEDLAQQKLDQKSQRLEGLTSVELSQQSIGSDHFARQTEDQLKFEQQIVSEHLENSPQQRSEQLAQRTEGQLEFGQQTVSNRHLKDLTQQSEQLMQQTAGSNELVQQTVGKLEFGQQSVSNQHLQLQNLTQQSEQFMQQAQGQLEFGQQTIDNQRLRDLMQQSEQSPEQMDQLEFGEQIIGNQHLEDLTQQTKQFQQQIAESDLVQRTTGKLEFSQQTDDEQRAEQHLTQQIEQSAHRTARSDNLTQQTVGKFEFGQHIQSMDDSTEPKNRHWKEFNQSNEDFVQQTAVADDFARQRQETTGRLKFGQMQMNMEDSIEQSKDLSQRAGEFDSFTQQTTGRLEYGQRGEQQESDKYNTQHLEQLPQKNNWDADELSQQSYQYPSYEVDNEKQFQSKWQLEQLPRKTDLDQNLDQRINRQPAPKPKPRQRYQKDDLVPSHADRTHATLDDFYRPIEASFETEATDLNGGVRFNDHLTHAKSDHHRSETEDSPNHASSKFDSEKNMDRLHWVHKSNDATVGLQWHYAYHPSDLTNIESSHNIYYPHPRPFTSQQKESDEDAVQRRSKLFNFDQRETQDERVFQDQQMYTAHDQHPRLFQQTGTSLNDPFQFDQNSQGTLSKAIPLLHGQDRRQASEVDQHTTETAETTEHKEFKLEPRILEAYGGGPYDASHNDDVYSRVKPNPSATLLPIGDDDPWDVREIPREMIPWSVARVLPVATTQKIRDVTVTAATVTPTAAPTMEVATTEKAMSFWSRLGHKITNTYGKAKEKAREIFG